MADTTMTTGATHTGSTWRLADLVASFSLSYVIGVFMLGFLLYVGDIWDQLSNTRFLDLLVRGGIVRLTDAQRGFIPHVPDLQYYVESQDPIDWGLVLVTASVLLVIFAIRSLQFRDFARYSGVDGSASDLGRLYLYGTGVNRFLPFNLGQLSIVSGLQARGATLDQANNSVFMIRLFAVMEIAFFGLIGLTMLGWTVWLSSLFWALVIAGGAYLMVRPRFGNPLRRRRNRGAEAESATVTTFGDAARETIRGLVQRPSTFLRMGVLSLIVFTLEIVAAFTIAQAFTSAHVILKANTDLLIMAMVAGSIARFIPLTPGGIGQFEWGFAACLYLGGVGLPESVTLAVLNNGMRYVVGTLVLGGVMMRGGAGTSVRGGLELTSPVAPSREGAT